jgi:hypothetical protein
MDESRGERQQRKRSQAEPAPGASGTGGSVARAWTPPGKATRRRRRKVRWARRLRRAGRAWQNALEIARAGRLTAP